MFITKNLTMLAVAALANKALALNTHRHAHLHIHERARFQTEVVTVTDWVTVTVYDDGETETPTVAPAVFVTAEHTHNYADHHAPASSSEESPSQVSSAASATAAAASSDPPIAPLPTTLATKVVGAPPHAPPPSTQINIVPSVVAPPIAPPPSTAAASTTQVPQPTTKPSTGSSGLKRGLAYNDPSLLSGFVGSGSKVSWAYNWGQTNDMKVNVEFVPMLWAPNNDHVPTWNANANKAIASGSKCLLSFNEPDNAGQANISPGVAKDGHIKYLNPFQGQARIGAPAITNSAQDGQGISWLKQFISVCAGQCAIDFVPVHWYNTASTDDFFNHLRAVHAAVPDKPVWITEFAPFGSDAEINTFLATVVHTLDNDPDFAFVERYSYFMVSPGSLISSGTSLSVYGNTFAYA